MIHLEVSFWEGTYRVTHLEVSFALEGTCLVTVKGVASWEATDQETAFSSVKEIHLLRYRSSSGGRCPGLSAEESQP